MQSCIATSCSLGICNHRAQCFAVQAATGEDVTAEELGGAELHCTTSGGTHTHKLCIHAVTLASNTQSFVVKYVRLLTHSLHQFRESLTQQQQQQQ